MSYPDPIAWFDSMVRSRATVHEYSTDPIPDELVQGALQRFVTAPNHRLTEPWRFVWVGALARQRLADVAVALKREKGALSDRIEQEVRDKITNPPVLVVLCRIRHEKPEVEREDYAAIACGAQTAMLWLWAHGVGSKWSTGAVTTTRETYELLGIPSGQEIVGFLWMGRAAREPKKPARKCTLAELLRRVA